ncbi:hypothetical protein ACIQF6_19590 [Kitasatospora sp. NPDC092948]|uniref:hypothetical protein n=1 Tax=Kitasatospora sp. NPDC092948 TaxID=3364088 RepID=UPI00380E7B8C
MTTATAPTSLPEDTELDLYRCRACGTHLEATARVWLSLRQQPDGTPLVFIDSFIPGGTHTRCAFCGTEAPAPLRDAVAALVARTNEVAGVVL